MLKVMIVDDESIIRSGLREKLDWNSLGFEITGEAANGQEALILAKSLDPDVIITDMKMPVMDGIKLLVEISTQGFKAKVIVVSAYSSFNYTHAAVQNGAFDYILKPIDSDELIDILKKVKASIELTQLKESHITSETHIMQEAIPFYKEKFLNSFMTSDITVGNSLKTRMLELGILINHHQYVCIAIRIPELFEIIKTTFNDDYDKAFECITRLIQNTALHESIHAITFKNPLYALDFFVILGFDYKQFDLSEMAENFKNDIETFLNIGISLSVGSLCMDFNDIRVSFSQALEALNYRSIVNDNCIIFSDDIQTAEHGKIVYSSEKENAFLTSLEICNREEMEYNITQLFEYIREHKDVTFRQVYKLCSELLFLSERILRKYDGNIESIFKTNITSIDYIACRGSLNQLEKWFSQVIHKIMQYIMDQKSNNMGNVIENIKTYIDTHYFEDINLNILSQKFYINKSYLSALFKKRENETFLDYLTSVRMNKAVKLLESKKYKVYEVSQLVGYIDNNYFSKLFKKYFGESPEKYTCKKSF